MACGKFRQEFKCRNLLLDHPHPEYFTTSQWRWPPVVYVLYRVVAALYLLVWLVLSGVLGSDGSRWFLYLTNWTFLLLNLKTVFMAITAILGYVTTRTAVGDIDGSCTQKMPWYLKAQWVIYNTATTSSLIVTVAYWALLWRPGSAVSANNFHVHAFNSLYVLLDLFITATPVRLLHVWHPLLYGALYLVFTLLYTGLGGTNAAGNNYIYGILDFYSAPGTAVLLSLGVLLLGLPLLWAFMYGMAALRVHLSQRCCKCGRDYQGAPPEGGDTHHTHQGEPPFKGSTDRRESGDHRLSEDHGHSADRKRSVKWEGDEEMGQGGEKPASSNGDKGRQSTVFVTETSGGHDNQSFNTTPE